MHLRPCSGCDRHVRADVTLCPFCDAALTAEAAVAPPQAARLGRAAQMAFGAAAVAASLSVVSCTKNPGGDDSSNIAQPYGAPPGTNIAQPYGAPPDPTPARVDAAVAPEVDASTGLAVAATVDAGHEAGKRDAGTPKPPPTRDWANQAKPYGAPPADGMGLFV